MKYCPKCGYITGDFDTKCIICGNSPIFFIEEKWGMTEKWRKDRFDRYNWHKISYRQYHQEFVDRAKPFINTVVKPNPDFDPELYDQLFKQRMAEHKEVLTRLEPEAVFVKCPYCKSRDTQKISSLSRSFSAFLFGAGSKKLGKQWHCKNCGSDF